MTQVVQARTDQDAPPGQMSAANLDCFFVTPADRVPVLFIGVQAGLCEQVEHRLVSGLRRSGVDSHDEGVLGSMRAVLRHHHDDHVTAAADGVRAEHVALDFQQLV